MAEQSSSPRRVRKDLGESSAETPVLIPKQADGPYFDVNSREALDIARYVTDMTAQLETMAVSAGLELIGYFLGMAKAESELYVRSNIPASEIVGAPGEEKQTPLGPEFGDDVA